MSRGFISALAGEAEQQALDAPLCDYAPEAAAERQRRAGVTEALEIQTELTGAAAREIAAGRSAGGGGTVR